MRFLSFITATLLTFSGLAQVEHRSSSPHIVGNTIIFKVKPQYRAYCSKDGFSHHEFLKVADQLQMESCAKEFPNHLPPNPNPKYGNSNGLPQVDITTIYKFKYKKDYGVRTVIPYLEKTGLFEYVEPLFIYRPLYTPNDDEVGSQYHLTNIKAFDAWDVEKGDTSVVIGITDTGIQYTHPDLKDNIKYNYGDPINGTDDDGDGYTDNFQGWDMVGNDNDATTHWSAHGIPVAGLASAQTDNDTMVAGTGFKCKFLPINVANSNSQITMGYQGIVYAADHGCQIINASWGEENSYSRYGQDVVTYATITKNALVVCAAGNNNDEGVYYPASLEWSLSVGGTDQSDEKWVASASKGSNYNYHVDICAPATGILSTYSGDKTLGNRTGTSVAAPMVAGAAALIKSKFPAYTSVQIGELLKATADSLEGIGSNSTYSGKIGEGRLNMHRALTETHISGFVMTPVTFTDGDDDVFVEGDTVSLTGAIYNFLNTSTAAAQATITTSSPNVEIINGTVSLGVLNNGMGKSIAANPFTFKVKSGVGISEVVTFLITYTDGANNDTKQAVDVTLNSDYYTIKDNKLDMTVGASGKLGYNVINKQSQGVGVEYNGNYSWLWQMSLVVLDDATKVSYVGDGDFETNSALTVDKTGNEADIVVNTTFDDDPAAANKLGITVKQKSIAWTEAQYEDFVIVEYKIINNSGTNYSNIHVGLHADWDIVSAGLNVATVNTGDKVAVAYYGSSAFVGIHALSDSTFQHYAFDNGGANGSINLYDGFSDAEKHQALTNGNSRSVAGTGDVSHLVGSGPFKLDAGDSIVVPFAILGGSSLGDMTLNSLKSDTAYNDIRSLSISINSSNVTCNGGADGSATANVTKGVKSYSYLWDAPGNPTTQTVNGLTAGMYKVIVTDSVGNKDSSTVTITEPSALMLSFSDTTHDVGGACKGELTAVVSGGTPTYVINWKDDAGRDSLHAINLCQGDYELTITDANGCIVKDTVTIDNTVGREELVFGGLTMYPNPANSSITFDGVSEEVLSIEINDVQGKLIKVINVQNTSRIVFDVSDLSKGVYQAVLRTQDLQKTESFTVIK